PLFGRVKRRGDILLEAARKSLGKVARFGKQIVASLPESRIDRVVVQGGQILFALVVCSVEIGIKVERGAVLIREGEIGIVGSLRREVLFLKLVEQLLAFAVGNCCGRHLVVLHRSNFAYLTLL